MPRSSARTALVLLTALNFLNYVDRYVLPAVQVPLEREIPMTNEMYGLLFSSFFIFYSVAAIPIGILADRYPRRIIIAAGGLIWSGATLLTAFTYDYKSLFIRHLLVGVGEASFATIAPAFLSDLYDEEDRGKVLGIFNTALVAGMAVGTILGTKLGGQYGWRMPFYVGAAPGFVVSLLIFLVPEPQRGAKDATHVPEKRHILGLFRNKAFLTASLGMAMLTFSESGLQTYVIKYLVTVRDVSLSAAGSVFGGMSLFNGIVAVLIGGWIGDRLLRKRQDANYLLSSLAMGLAIPTMLVTIYGPRATLWAAMFVTEFVLFLNTGPLNAAIVNSVAAPIRATALAINIFIIHFLGDVPAPAIMGRIADKTNLPTAFAAAIAACAMSSLVLYYGMRFAPKLQQHRTGT
jgi:MFS transporter, Spinster family, sphingosine-1-phosphate transporter